MVWRRSWRFVGSFSTFKVWLSGVWLSVDAMISLRTIAKELNKLSIPTPRGVLRGFMDHEN